MASILSLLNPAEGSQRGPTGHSRASAGFMDTVIDRRLHDEPPRYSSSSEDQRREPLQPQYYSYPQQQIAIDADSDYYQREPPPREPDSSFREGSFRYPSGSHIYNHPYRTQHSPERPEIPVPHRLSPLSHDTWYSSKEPAPRDTYTTRHPYMHPGTVATQPAPASSSSQDTAPAGPTSVSRDRPAPLPAYSHGRESTSHESSSTPPPQSIRQPQHAIPEPSQELSDPPLPDPDDIDISQVNHPCPERLPKSLWHLFLPRPPNPEIAKLRIVLRNSPQSSTSSTPEDAASGDTGATLSSDSDSRGTTSHDAPSTSEWALPLRAVPQSIRRQPQQKSSQHLEYPPLPNPDDIDITQVNHPCPERLPRSLWHLFLPRPPNPEIAKFQIVDRASLRLAAQSSRSPSTGPSLDKSPAPRASSSSDSRSPLDVDQLDQGSLSSSESAGNKRRADDIPAREQPAPKRVKSTKPKSAGGAGTRRNGGAKRSGVDGNRLEWTYTGTLGGDVIPELQQARCMSSRYKNEVYSKCISCTRRWAGDTCRFQNMRLWIRKKDNGETTGVSFTSHVLVKQQGMQYPVKWNVEFQNQHASIVQYTVARALLPVLEEELAHLHLHNEAGSTGVVHRGRETECRATCDTCLTSLFSRSWMCNQCGREQCPDCYEQMKKLTRVPRNASHREIVAFEDRRNKHMATNPSFFTCGRKEDHDWEKFFPVSRFSKSDLTEAIAGMKHTLQHGKHTLPQRYQPPSNASSPSDVPSSTRSMSSGRSSSGGPLTPPGFAELAFPPEPKTLYLDGQAHPRNNNDLGDIPSYELSTFTFAQLTKDVFRSMWANGIPFVVTGLKERLKLPWTPQYFIDTYGDQSCLIIECQNDTNKNTTVKEFFSQFGQYSGRKGCWKLKDWPPMSDFQTSFPELYDDFSQALPMPDYVRRDGVLNVASHFPRNTVVPDLGPKMYNAMASTTATGSKGSTRLHMDMADAMNIMTYAAPREDGSPGCAAWDLFRAEDSDKIRQFLKSRTPARKGGPPQDPIHSQQLYLDDVLRKALFDEYGVKSFRFYQQAGEAVFIPAGCAHQVSNLSDCIKIAVDFVSPENIDRCEQLTREFREQNHALAWKEDVLQLRSMMWFAWQSCSKQEKLHGWAESESDMEVDQLDYNP